MWIEIGAFELDHLNLAPTAIVVGVKIWLFGPHWCMQGQNQFGLVESLCEAVGAVHQDLQIAICNIFIHVHNDWVQMQNHIAIYSLIMNIQAKDVELYGWIFTKITLAFVATFLQQWI